MMSTKITLDHQSKKGKCPEFHAYLECFDKDNQAGTVYVELRGEDVFYQVSNGRVVLGIPHEVWKRLQAIKPIKFGYNKLLGGRAARTPRL
jgi:hypothetical protein